MKINELSRLAHETAVEKGFYETPNRPLSEILVLIITEISEAVQEDRKGNFEKFKEEIADTYIRLGDLCGFLDIDIEAEIKRKMEINKSRPKKHNRRY